MREIPFNKPYSRGFEIRAVSRAIDNAHLSADGPYSARCREWLARQTAARDVLLVHSCTAALEASALLADLGPGDEVIMPSYTFVTTASAFALRGAVPVFVDIRPDTLNIDEHAAAEAVTDATRAIVPVHYAGVACRMDEILDVADRFGLYVIEDAAQGVMASCGGRALGTMGHLGALSFHETKNVTCGEGGALLVNDERLAERAQIIRDKGTNRARFLSGLADKYTWIELGSSFGMSDLNAAFLWAQLGVARELTGLRRQVWDRYHTAFAGLEEAGVVRRPVTPEGAEHNAHMYYLLLPCADHRDRALRSLNARGVNAVFHYVPLHSSPAGSRLGRAHGSLRTTDDVSARIIRLPLWAGMQDEDVEYVIDEVHRTVTASGRMTTAA